MLNPLVFPYPQQNVFNANRGSLGTLLLIKKYKVNPRLVKCFCNVYNIRQQMMTTITTQQDLSPESQPDKKSAKGDTISIEKLAIDFDLYTMHAFMHKFPYTVPYYRNILWDSTGKAFQDILKDLLSKANESQLSKKCIKVKPDMLSILSYQKYFTTELFRRDFLQEALTKGPLPIIRGELFYSLFAKVFGVYDRLNLLLFLVKKLESLKLYSRKQIDHLLIKIGIIFNKQRINIKDAYAERILFKIGYGTDEISDTNKELIRVLREIFLAPKTECSRATKELQELISTIMRTLIESKYFDDDALYIEKAFRKEEDPWVDYRWKDDVYYKIMLLVIGSILFPHIKEMDSRYKLPVLRPLTRKKVIRRLKEHFYLLLVIRSSQGSFYTGNNIIPKSNMLDDLRDHLRGISKYPSQPLEKYEELTLNTYLNVVTLSLFPSFYMSIAY